MHKRGIGSAELVKCCDVKHGGHSVERKFDGVTIDDVSQHPLERKPGKSPSVAGGPSEHSYCQRARAQRVNESAPQKSRCARNQDQALTRVQLKCQVFESRRPSAFWHVPGQLVLPAT